MNTQTLKKTISFGLSLMLTLMSALALPVQAQNPKSWTAAASAGVVDEGDLDDVSLGSGGLAQLNTGDAPNAQAIIRYNVTATEGLFVTGYPRMRARFVDSGVNSQVIVSLRRVHLTTGASSTLLQIDSNDYAASNAFQTQATGQCDGANFSFDFTNYAYYVEVTLTRTSNNGLAKLQSLQLYNFAGNLCQ